MGGISDDGELLYELRRPTQPSGRVQVLEPKDFPFLHTGHSLVFVIARNGMVWGKRLDGESERGDIELEVFWPVEGGCLLRFRDCNWCALSTLEHNLSRSQLDKIQSILSQKEIIQYELGTLVVRSVCNVGSDSYRNIPQYQRITEKCKLSFPFDEPCNIKVVDCLYGSEEWSGSMFNFWTIIYDDKNSAFRFSASSDMASVIEKRKHVFPIENVLLAKVHDWRSENDYLGNVCFFYTAQLEDRKFNVSNWEPCLGRKLFKPELRIMYGENNFFEYFEIDDAALLLEELHEKSEVRFCWTLAIAQNKHVREMMRLASNNPDLFKSLFPRPLGGRGGVKIG